MIVWKYIDKEQATVSAIKDYNMMQKIIAMTPDSIKLITPATTPMRFSFDNDLLQNRYEAAKEYMEWFEPAWQSLNKTEQTILKEYYMTGNKRTGAPIRLSINLNYSERQIQRLRQQSLEKLASLLFGN